MDNKIKYIYNDNETPEDVIKKIAQMSIERHIETKKEILNVFYTHKIADGIAFRGQARALEKGLTENKIIKDLKDNLIDCHILEIILIRDMKIYINGAKAMDITIKNDIVSWN